MSYIKCLGCCREWPWDMWHTTPGSIGTASIEEYGYRCGICVQTYKEYDEIRQGRLFR